jgi:hypothetical protein
MAEDRYSVRQIRFVLVPDHTLAYQAAYLDQSSASSHELERLHREFQTLPPRHDCSCRCPQERRGYPPCRECLRLRQSAQPIPLEHGRSGIYDSAVPSPLMLDLHRAISALDAQNRVYGVNPSMLARYLNGPDSD